jgi:hypothetical protein
MEGIVSTLIPRLPILKAQLMLTPQSADLTWNSFIRPNVNVKVPTQCLSEGNDAVPTEPI